MKSPMPENRNVMLLALLLLALSIPLSAAEKTKTLKKEFVVGQDVRLNIETSYGKVHLNVWDKNLMTIDVLVTAEASSEKNAQQLLDNITPVITGNSSQVDIVTRIGNTGSSGKNRSFSIDYTINMPRSSSLNADTRFADLFLDESTGVAKINVEYGNLTINKLTNPAADITLKFSNASIFAAADMKLDAQYSNLKSKSSGKVSCNSKFSTLDMGELTSLGLTSGYDTYTIEQLKSVSGTAKFSNITINELKQKLDLDMDYGGLDVKHVNPSFSMISLTASFNGIDLGIPPSASYQLSADMSFGELNYPKGANITVAEKSYTSKTYTGTVGSSKSPVSKVYIRGKNCDVKVF